jgi:EAL domain-containing protein (putative c-di-GMP-specific phosphodiesterase class I)
LIDLDYLKIDRSFTDFTIEANRKICHGIIQMAKGLELQTIGEGVEHLEQAELLREMGCDFAQGYFFARPKPAAEAEAFLKDSISRGGTVV